jgi:hypothetical protein
LPDFKDLNDVDSRTSPAMTIDERQSPQQKPAGTTGGFLPTCLPDQIV